MKQRILVVDDEPQIREMLSIYFSSHGYETVTAGDSTQAMQAVEEAKVDVAVLDIGLADHTDDAFYLSVLQLNFDQLLSHVNPDFIFFQSGVDILDTDQLGRLKVSRAGCKQRDRIVLQTAHRNKIPLVVTMGGGYSKNFLDIIEAHANTYRLAQEIFF